MPRTPRTTHLALRELAESGRIRSSALVDALIAEIAGGRLGEGDWLPSSRALATQLRCSRTLVDRAYSELIAAGLAESLPGSGTRVAEGAAAGTRVAEGAAAGTRVGAEVVGGRSRLAPAHELTSAAAASPRPHLARDLHQHRDLHDLRPGRPDVDLIDTSAWLRSLRRAGLAALTTSSPRELGNPALTSALADHLRRHRGIRADGLVPVPGCAQAFRLIAEVARAQGLTRAYVESPCYASAFDEFVRVGLEVVPVAVDEDGLRVADLPDPTSPSAPGLVYVTPAHQYPIGHRMSVPRRAELITWARSSGSLVVEDDYDGEFRFGVPPLPALRSMAGAEDCVVYVGTSSKILSPGLVLAWVVPPAHLAEALADLLWDRRVVVNATIASALADFIATGELARHLARAGRHYRDRRNALVRALSAKCPHLTVLGVEAGLHVCVEVDSDAEVAAALRARGWTVSAVSEFPALPQTDMPSALPGGEVLRGGSAPVADPAPLGMDAAGVRSGLVIGFATLAPARAREFAGVLAEVLAAQMG